MEENFKAINKCDMQLSVLPNYNKNIRIKIKVKYGSKKRRIFLWEI